jgi:hypothetical protein
MSRDAEAPVPAVGVIDSELAGHRRSQYMTSMLVLARRHRLRLVRILVLGALDIPVTQQISVVLAGAGTAAVIAPSVGHLRGAHRWVTARADLYVVRPLRIYRRGYRWSAPT